MIYIWERLQYQTHQISNSIPSKWLKTIDYMILLLWYSDRWNWIVCTSEPEIGLDQISNININIYNIGVRTTDWFSSWKYIQRFINFLNEVVLSSSWKYCWQKMIKQYQERPVRELYNVCLNHNLQWPRWQ